MSAHLREQIEFRRAAGGPFLTAWLPLLEPLRGSLVDWMVESVELGADLVALELPSPDGLFFDPAGALLCRAAPEAIALEGALDLLAAGRVGIDAPVLLASYAEPLLAIGVERVAEQAVASGVDAVAVVDLAPGDANGLADTLRQAGLAVVYGVSTAAPRRRLSELGERSDGLLWGQDPFGREPDEIRAAVRDHRRVSRRTGCVLLVDPTEVPPPKIARRLGGIVLRRVAIAAWEGGLSVGDAVGEALAELRGTSA